MIENLISAAAALSLKIVEGFWDESKEGKKPEGYLVWYYLNGNYDIEADDVVDEESNELGLSYYSKKGAANLNLKNLRCAFEQYGFEVLPGGFSTYERDTGYFHREYRLVYYE